MEITKSERFYSKSEQSFYSISTMIFFMISILLQGSGKTKLRIYAILLVYAKFQTYYSSCSSNHESILWRSHLNQGHRKKYEIMGSNISVYILQIGTHKVQI